jgi:hypothetical protein
MIDRDDFYIRLKVLSPDSNFVFWKDDGFLDKKGYDLVTKIDEWIVYWNDDNKDPIPSIDDILSINDHKVNAIKFESIGTPLLNSYINEVAQEKKYDSALSCSSYISSNNPKWKAEAIAFVSWRDAVFDYTLEQFNLISLGLRLIPTFEEFKLELPVINWP